jgi:hypothetical protein
VLTTGSRAPAKQPTMMSAHRDAAPSVLQTSELGPQKKRLFAILLVVLVLFGLFSIPRRVRLRGREVPTPASDTESSSASPSEQTPPAEPQPADAAPSVPPAKEQAPPISKPEAAEPDTIALEISALENANIVFRTAGQPTETLAMTPGESATLRAQKEGTLVVSNTAAFQAKLNGKPLSFGPGQRAGEFLITPDGIDETRSVTGASSLPSSPPAAPPASDPPPQADSAPLAHSARNIGSLPRQLELVQAANSVRLVIKSPAIPEFVTVIVRADSEVLFRREATALPPEGFEEGLRRVEGAVPTTALSEERLLPPGSHTLDVTILLGRTRLGQTQEISAQLSPKDRRTLLIQFPANPVRAGQRGAARFTITLD